jgi:hypothetical protein
MDTNNEQSQLDKRGLFGSVILFDEALKCGDGRKFYNYFGTKAELLYVEFCNFVQYLIFVNC